MWKHTGSGCGTLYSVFVLILFFQMTNEWLQLSSNNQLLIIVTSDPNVPNDQPMITIVSEPPIIIFPLGNQ